MGRFIFIAALGLGWAAFAQNPTAYSEASGLVQQGRFDQAIPILNRILTASPTDLKARNLLGIALLSSGHKNEAAIEFQKVLQITPDFRPALKNLAVAEMELGRYNSAKPHFEQLVKLSPNDPVAHSYLGELASRDHRYVDAVREFQLARNGYPDGYQLGLRLLAAFLGAHRNAEAIQTGEQLLKEGHHKAELYNLLARAYEADGRTQQAYDALRSATQVDPEEEANYLDLMSLCLAHENWDLSLEIADVGLSHIPQAWRIRLQRGAVLALQGKMEDAEKEFFAASRAAPRADLPEVVLALVQIDRSRFDEAIEGLRAHRSSEDYRIHWLLGEALSRTDAEPGSAREKEAVAELHQAVRLNSKAPAPRVLLGKLLAKRGDAAGATAQFETALKSDPNEMSAAYQLAILYRKQGKTSEAERLAALVAKSRSASDSSPLTRRNLTKIIREGSK